MQDWTEHATTIVVVLLAAMALLGRALWEIYCKREEQKENLVAQALDRIGGEVSGLRVELKEMAAELFGRLGVNEKNIAEIKARCETIHAQWAGAEKRPPSPQDFGFGSILGGTEKR